jgi:hypothetical protein
MSPERSRVCSILGNGSQVEAAKHYVEKAGHTFVGEEISTFSEAIKIVDKIDPSAIDVLLLGYEFGHEFDNTENATKIAKALHDTCPNVPIVGYGVENEKPPEAEVTVYVSMEQSRNLGKTITDL